MKLKKKLNGNFNLKIELGNDAMQTAKDIAKALKNVADLVGEGQTDGVIQDENGNRVGTFQIS